jgi:hypothetical protein
VLVLLALIVPRAHAAPILQGESQVSCANIVVCPDPEHIFIRVDWQVFAPDDPTAPLGATPGLFQYVYELEATTGNNQTGQPNDIGSFTITYNSSAFTFIDPLLDAGPGPLVIGDETNPVTGNPLDCCTPSTGTQNTSGTATWFFDPKIPQDFQSNLLVGLSPDPPILGESCALDGQPGSPWCTSAPFGEEIPLPGPQVVPNPASLLLFGIGLIAAGAITRRRFPR